LLAYGLFKNIHKNCALTGERAMKAPDPPLPNTVQDWYVLGLFEKNSAFLP